MTLARSLADRAIGMNTDVWYITANINASSATVTMNANWARLADNPVTNASSQTLTYSSNMTGSIGNAMRIVKVEKEYDML